MATEWNKQPKRGGEQHFFKRTEPGTTSDWRSLERADDDRHPVYAVTADSSVKRDDLPGKFVEETSIAFNMFVDHGHPFYEHAEDMVAIKSNRLGKLTKYLELQGYDYDVREYTGFFFTPRETIGEVRIHDVEHAEDRAE